MEIFIQEKQILEKNGENEFILGKIIHLINESFTMEESITQNESTQI
jgi:hypothetical protein